MKIVILSGGTGSVAIQTGIYEQYESNIENIDVKILINAYDSGLSTGLVRKVANGKILGPSDLRKNQTIRLKLEQPKSPWHDFLDIRFTKQKHEVKEYCQKAIDSLIFNLQEESHVRNNRRIFDAQENLNKAIETYFNSPIAMQIDYNDFSLANIIYAGLAMNNKNSLRKAGTLMASFMDIKDNVILNDDRSLFLGGITQSGKRITDEGDIVSWNNIEDPFVDVFFTDENGDLSKPILSDEAHDALREADLIILSSGTQWSSLIPTYESVEFKELIYGLDTPIVMVSNKVPDKDSPGQSISDLIKLLTTKYFPKQKIDLVCSLQSADTMKYIDPHAQTLVKSYEFFKEENGHVSKHGPKEVVTAIFKSYFIETLFSSQFVFDYDDTLVGRNNIFNKTAEFNKNTVLELAAHGFNRIHPIVSICSGNSIKAINLTPKNSVAKQATRINVFGDLCSRRYSLIINGNTDNDEHLEEFKFIKDVTGTEDYDLDSSCFSIEEIEDLLLDIGIKKCKIENRANRTIAIKPIDAEYRPIVTKYIEHILEAKKSGLHIAMTGRSTIEISMKPINKMFAVNELLNENPHNLLTYVGDEWAWGNDHNVFMESLTNKRIKFLKVSDHTDTAIFLTTLKLVS